jgi:transcriptional regulator with XRE-family HTH domain
MADVAAAPVSGSERVRSRAASERANEAWLRMSDSDRRSFLRSVAGEATNPHAEGLARLIRDLGERGARGWKQDLASKLGVSPGYVSKFLRPPYPSLSKRTAAQIEQRLGLDEGALARGVRAEDLRTSERSESELGARILDAYQAKGLTRTAFARAIGVKPNSVWRYEQGESRPRPDTLARIADVTGRSLEWLLVGERRERVDSAAPPSAYDLVRRMDARELRAFCAWVLAWTDEGPDAS